jgi:dTDP-4-dehydrorhamnose 3,5-epimerase
MRVRQTTLHEVMLIEPTVLVDERGYLFESCNRDALASAVGAPVEFVLDLQSKSVQGVIRGIHYQVRHPQAKLISVVAGEVFDVAVDLRRSSSSFGKWIAVELSAENRRQIWIPPGFGHGFLTLSPSAEVLYKLSDYHSPDCSRTICWNDPALGIDWPMPPGFPEPILSQKDRQGLSFRDAEVFP